MDWKPSGTATAAGRKLGTSDDGGAAEAADEADDADDADADADADAEEDDAMRRAASASAAVRGDEG
jgi:hypothetical protein